MKTTLCIVALSLLISVPAAAEQQGFQDPLLDQMVGNWVMEGTIAGNESVHDFVAEWVLDHQYLRFHEVAREIDPDGKPLYEAIVFIGWDKPTNQYACLWLDSTGGGGLNGKAIGYAKPGGDDLPFEFDAGDGSAFHTTFTYRRDTDTWKCAIDIVNGDERTQFGRVMLTRR